MLSYSVSGNSGIGVSIVGNIATISSTQGWNGVETITFTAQDVAGLKVSDQVVYGVTAVNNDLAITFISPIANEQIGEGVYQVELNVSNPSKLSTIRLFVIDKSITDLSNPFREFLISLTSDGFGNYSGEWKASTSGDFTLEVQTIDDNNNFSTSSIDVTIDKGFEVGVDDVNMLSLLLDLYPNPTTDVININGEFEEWILITQDGSQIESGSDDYIDIESLSTGVYILLIDGQANKFVKQ